MKVTVYFIIFIAIVCGCSSSHKPSENNSISGWNVIAKKVMHPDPLIECDLNLVNQKTVFPLSNLVTEFKLIKLDNATKERMISVNDKICLSTNHIIVYGSGRNWHRRRALEKISAEYSYLENGTSGLL